MASGSGLATLARAAAMCCEPVQMVDAQAHDPSLKQSIKAKQKNSRSCCSSSPTSSPPSKRPRRRSSSKPSEKAVDAHEQRGPSLPPIISGPFASSGSLSSTDHPAGFPGFPVIPSLSTIASLAGTGCTCGFDCTCPGCVEHRGPEHADKEDHTDCPDGCSTCIDHHLRDELPKTSPFGATTASVSSTSASGESSSPSFLDVFFARAAASIPRPPSQRASTITLDPTNITVYPTSLFSLQTNGTQLLDERGPAFGLVRLPKLECCAGRCGCPGDSCACGTNCDGCCAEHHGEEDWASGKQAHILPTEDEVVTMTAPSAGDVVRSCCAG